MLPPNTIPSRSTTASDTDSTGAIPLLSAGHAAPSSSTSSTNSIPQQSSSRLVWSDRAYISSGSFAGKSMRFNLEVAQQPIHGRRKTEKDRRPLAHCPIIRLRLKECKRITDATVRGHPDWEEGWEEEEIDVSTVESSNFLCAADLFSPDETPIGSPSIRPRPTLRASDDPAKDVGQPPDRQGSGSSSTSSRTVRGSPERPRRPPPAPMSTYPSRSVDGDITMGRNASFLKGDASPGPMPQRPHLAHGYARGESSPDVLRQAHDAPAQLPEGMEDLHETQQTKEERRSRTFGRNLYGNSHVTGIRVPAPEGGVGLWFLFTDITVKHEGSYTLRFRCFDITSVPSEGAAPSPPLVTTHSQAFTVYSPRNFPGIPKPTELAEHFNRLGFKLNTRKNERIAEEPSHESSNTPTRRPSPSPIQHHDGRHPSGSQGRQSHNNTSSSTASGGGSSSSATDTGTMTAPSSTGESGAWSGGSGGIPHGGLGSSGSIGHGQNQGSTGLSRIDGNSPLP